MRADSAKLEDLELEAHVWLAWPDEIEAPELLDQYLELLSADERRRHARFQFEVHRKLFLVSHALVRTTLSRYADVAAVDWEFLEGEFGRPEIAPGKNAKGLRFNLSHTEGLAALVVTRGIDCGVDVERLNRVKDLDGVANRVFTQSERQDLNGRVGNDLQGRFTDYWTLKEAYMKARGKGFRLPPHTFTVRLDSPDESRATLELSAGFDDTAEDWQLALHRPARKRSGADGFDYRLAVALRRDAIRDRSVVVRSVNPG